MGCCVYYISSCESNLSLNRRCKVAFALSNENLALSQYGQATFTGLQTFPQGASSLFFDPASTPLGWRSWLGAWYVEDSIRFGPNLKVTLGFRDEFSNGWNEVNGRASNYTFTNGVINTNPLVGSSVFTTKQC